MKHITTLISEKVLIDQESKLVSIIDITEKLNVDINTKKNPLPEKEKLTINTNLNLLSIWFREDVKNEGELEFKVEIIDPNNKAVSNFIKTIAFPKNSSRLRIRVKLNQIVVTVSGIYYFKVYEKNGKKWNGVQEVPFEVEIKRNN